MPNCPVCRLAVENPQDLEYLRIHPTCRICVYCHTEIFNDGVELLVTQAFQTGKESEPITPCHSFCVEKHLRKELSSRPLTITQGHLDEINKYLAMVGFSASADEIQPILDINLSVETNQQRTELAGHRVLTDLPAELKFLLVKTLQNTAVVCSMLANKDQRVRNVQLEISKRDREKFEEVQKIRENKGKEEQESATTRHARAVRKTEIEIDTAQKLAEKENPQLKLRRKAFESLMRTIPGLTPDAANAILDAQKG